MRAFTLLFRPLTLAPLAGLLLVTVAGWGSLLLVRLFFAIANHERAASLDLTALAGAFVLGARFDAILLGGALAVPALLFVVLPAGRLRSAILALGGALVFVCVLAGAIEALYYARVERHVADEWLSMTAQDWLILAAALGGGTLAWASAGLAVALAGGELLRRAVRSANRVTAAGWFWRVPMIAIVAVAALLLVRGGATSGRPLFYYDAWKLGHDAAADIALPGAYAGLVGAFQKQGERRRWFDDAETTRRLATDGPSVGLPDRVLPSASEAPRNVVLIVVESLSANYVDRQGKQGFGVTPFLDSLHAKSVSWPLAFSAGQRSIEGLQGILASKPVFPGRQVTGFGGALHSVTRLGVAAEQAGAASVLLQTSPRRSFHLEGIASALGITDFQGSEDFRDRLVYPQPRPYTGWDYEGLQHFKERLDAAHAKRGRFVGVIYTGSTHEPYPQVDPRFMRRPHQRDGEAGFLNVLGYTDWAIGEFFKVAEAAPWYRDTVFIVTGDHPRQGSAKRIADNFAVPMLWFDPRAPQGRVSAEVASHYDLLPTLLSIAGYRDPVRSIGRPLMSAGVPAPLPAWRLVKHGNQAGLAGGHGAAVGSADGWTAREGETPPIEALRLLQQEAGK
jgi:phosphoglycerol transferase MdoB-like AlkP superfamily enzyme